MSNQNLTIGLVAVAIIAIGGYFFPLIQEQLGATGTRFPNGVSADVTSPVAGELRGDDLTLDDDAVISDDVTISGGTLAVTTGAGATSTVTVGGIQTYATSSATSICLFFDVRGATSSFAGTAYWKYGTAPCQL